MNQLIAHELEELKDKPLEGFVVDSPDKANWALRKIRALRAKQDEAREIAEAEFQRVGDWLEQQTDGIAENISFFESLLEQYHIQEIANDPKAKTIKLPHGTLQMRAQQPEFIRDDEQIREWVEANRKPYLIPQPARLDWAGLKQDLSVVDNFAIDKETGEPVPGITVEHRPPKFSVKVD